MKQIKAVHARVKSGADFPRYVQDLKALGVTHYDIFVDDGRAVYYSTDGSTLIGQASYTPKRIAGQGSAVTLKQALTSHQQGQTTYLTFCEQAAEAGVAKWTTHVLAMDVTYVDRQGAELLVEVIP